MSSGRLEKLAAAYALLTGVTIIAWWAAASRGVLPTGFVSPQQHVSHIVAEIVLAIGLVVGAVLVLLSARWGRPILCPSLGALVYASVNAVGGPAQSPTLTGILVVTLALSITMLVTVLRVWVSGHL